VNAAQNIALLILFLFMFLLHIPLFILLLLLLLVILLPNHLLHSTTRIPLQFPMTMTMMIYHNGSCLHSIVNEIGRIT